MERRTTHRMTGPDYIEAARARGHEVNIGNPELPIAPYLPEIVESVRDNTFTILIGETGSGKTTQVPQALFAAGYQIDQTQPQRGSAHETAIRIGQELTASIPGLPESTVAIRTGEESTLTPASQIVMHTEGMLLQVDYNQSRNSLTTPKPNSVTIIDEAHKWNVETEMLVALLMQEAKTNPDLRVVLMSATLNKTLLAHRIEAITGMQPNVIEVPGRTYPVERFERPDMTSVSMTLELAKPGTGGLVFKRGLGPILDTMRQIEQGIDPKLRSKLRMFAAHSSIPVAQLSEAYNYEPAPDEIKIIVGTNAMETGLTINGITYVVDDGQANQVHTDKRGYEGLFITTIAQSQSNQRSGRAGRLGPGEVYMVRADDRSTYVPYDDRPEFEIPAVQRLDLRRVVLHLASIGVDMAKLPLINSVDQLSIIRARDSLSIVGAIDDDDRITDIGLQMDQFPVRTQLQRAIVESKRYDADIQMLVAAMAAAVDQSGLQQVGRFATSSWKSLSNESSSDLLRQLDMFIACQNLAPYEQHKLGISAKSVGRARETYDKILYRLGIEPKELVIPNESQHEALISCIYAGYVEYIFRRVGRTTFKLLDDSEPTDYKISDRSVVDPRSAKLVIGTPYVIQTMRQGKPELKHIIEAVTELPSIGSLGEAAVHLAKWSDERLVWKGGRAFERTDQNIRGVRTGVSHERMSGIEDLEYRLNEFVNYALDHPGNTQLRLRALKKELEALNHLAQDDIKPMTQDQYRALLYEAARRLDTLDTHYLEAELELIIQERGISRATFISDADVDQIHKNAPSVIERGGMRFEVEYRNGFPKIKHWQPEQIAQLHGPVTLPDDGRTVRFFYNKREYTLEDLKIELAKRQAV